MHFCWFYYFVAVVLLLSLPWGVLCTVAFLFVVIHWLNVRYLSHDIVTCHTPRYILKNNNNYVVSGFVVYLLFILKNIMLFLALLLICYLFVVVCCSFSAIAAYP